VPFRSGWRKLRNWFVHLLHLDASAHRIALGAAIGVFVAFTPTIGLQMLLIFFVTSLFRANAAAGVPMAWITNPATIPPIFYWNYRVGCLLLGKPDSAVEKFHNAVSDLAQRDLVWWALVKEWWDLAMRVAQPLWVGSVAVGVVAAALTYGLMYHLITVYRRAHQRHLAARAAAEAAGRGADRADSESGARP
jgi:hypothetical protein